MQPCPTVPALLLAMDTSGDVCSVAVFRNGLFAAEHAFRHEMHLSERLIGDVDAVLRSVAATLHDVDCYAVGIGPGSFTGARVGVMTMKTFAFIEGKPIVTVNGMEAMAAEYCALPEMVVTPVLACRSGVVYGCPYSVAGHDPVALAEPAAFTFAELGGLLQRLATGTFVFCGPVAHRYEVEIRSGLETRSVSAAFGAVTFPRAFTVGRLALQRLAAGISPVAALEIVPLYISPPPITLPKIQIPT